MSGINPIGKYIAKATTTRPAVWLGEKFQKNPESALAAATVSSIVLKDGIGCVMYVTQSLNNKKIPEEKRRFVAALDLTNGVLMIAAQIAMFLAMRKYSGPIFEKLFKKSFNAENKSNIISKLRMKAAEKGEAVYKKLKLEKDYEEVKKDALGLFKFVVDIAAATIVGKRIIVPLIATPLAKKVEKRMNKDNVKDESKTLENAEGDNKAITKSENATPQNTAYNYNNINNSENTNLLDKFRK